jgi:hypothetical protein
VSGWGDTDGSPPFQPSPTLQHATVDVLADSSCAVYPAYDGSQMLCALGAGPGFKDACVGDSGGPLALLTGGQPVSLIGIVSYGPNGCGDQTHPGVYTKVAGQSIHDFLTGALTPRAGAPSVSGTARVNDVLTCAAGTWEGATALGYQWLRDGQPIGAATAATYTATGDDQGHSLVCRVTGSNGSLTASADSAGSPAVAPAQTLVIVSPGADTTPPTSKLQRGKCTRARCTLTIVVTDTGGATGQPTVRFTLQRLTGCPRGKGGQRCRALRPITATRLGGGRFRVTLLHLAVARYRAAVTATDGAANRQRTATRLTFRVKRR